MKIKKITFSSRRDFTAIYVCEHCQFEEKSYGYDDNNFHQNVIPNMVCKKCGKKGLLESPKMEPKYPEDLVL